MPTALSPAFFAFFDELSHNNNKVWFDAHRSDYEKYVKVPFYALVAELFEAFRQRSVFVPNLEAKHFIMRINRDIRFSANKNPYKTHASAWFCALGKTPGHAGFYIHFGAEECFVGGGNYEPTKEGLYAIRQEIAYCNDEFESIIQAPAFKNAYGEVTGEKNKVLPAEQKEWALSQPLIYNKQFLFTRHLSREEVLNPDLAQRLIALYEAGKPFNDFIMRALGVVERKVKSK
jgi:uncharacterized protein (TIGR02453 family)